MKQCNRCNEFKEFNQFSKGISNKDGYSGQCKLCKAELTAIYNKTLIGKLTLIYNSQIKASKDRGHPEPKYSKKELIQHALTNTNFLTLYNTWKQSNYEKDLSPSFDRLDDSFGYSFNNLRLVTWQENNEKMYDQRFSGKRVTTQNKIIGKFTLDGIFIEQYPSIAKAARDNNVIRTNLNQAVKQNIPRFGYLWKYI